LLPSSLIRSHLNREAPLLGDRLDSSRKGAVQLRPHGNADVADRGENPFEAALEYLPGAAFSTPGPVS
jgi:hypothetical protein